MSDPLELARLELLEPAQLTEAKLEQVMSSMLSPQIDFADLYFQSAVSESWALEEGVVKSGNFSISRGVGVRAISGEKTGFAYADDITLPALQNSANAAKQIVRHGGHGKIKAWTPSLGLSLYSTINPLDSLSAEDKTSLLQTTDKRVRKADPRISQVVTSLSGSYETILIIGSDGQWSADVRPLIRFNISVIAEEKGRFERGSSGGGGRLDYVSYLTEETISRTIDEAVEVALLNLRAEPAPAGTMPVVLGAGWPAVLLHEAIGHGLEGDFNRKGSSAFSGRIGERVATSACTVVDDGTLIHRRGSLNIDDEGTPAQNTVLIEDGILKGYMQDKHNARLMNTTSTGNGRRESYAHCPIVRMTNTYMLPGKYEKDEIIASVEKGIYAPHFEGGQVDITSGNFVFTASQAYLIENGKLTKPIKGATLVGNGPEVLNVVSMVGNDLALDNGIGVCGKEGQSVPVGVGQPTLKLDAITVGGTN